MDQLTLGLTDLLTDGLTDGPTDVEAVWLIDIY